MATIPNTGDQKLIPPATVSPEVSLTRSCSPISQPTVIPSIPPPSTDLRHQPLFAHKTVNAFSDSYGRIVLLRGLNVAGENKVPMITSTFTGEEEEQEVSYTGRPFGTVQDANREFRRLRMWGVNVIRWVVTWEGIEPKKMGEYDEGYVEYVKSVLEVAGDCGLKCVIDGHQDCWSRISGGSGAPPWTYDVVGLKIDPTLLRETYTAALLPLEETYTSSYVFSEQNLPPQRTAHSSPSSHLWATNYTKLTAATMFTIFFSGDFFTKPNPSYELLQTAYINAMAYLAEKLSGLDCILGFDVINEPHSGYIGLEDLEKWDANKELHLGGMPNAIQGMVLASGGPPTGEEAVVKVPVYQRSFPGPSSFERYVEVVLRPENRIWKDGFHDVWLEAGVWEWVRDRDEKIEWRVKDEAYFSKCPRTGREINFERDFYEPFVRRFLKEVEQARRRGSVKLQIGGLQSPIPNGMGKWGFIEPVPNDGPMSWEESEQGESEEDGKETERVGGGIVYSPHWYDLRTCFDKTLSAHSVSFDVGALALGSRNFFKHTYFGSAGLKSNYTTQFKRVVDRLSTFRPSGNPTPVLIGETGVPFDVNNFKGYKTGKHNELLIMLDAICSAMERNMNGRLNWTIWNWTGNNSSRWYQDDSSFPWSSSGVESGDHWNSEDFSIISRDYSMVEVPLEGDSPTTASPAHNSPTNLGYPLTRARLFGDMYSGLRCIGAWIRPYPAKTAGILLKSEFVIDKRTFNGGKWEFIYIPSPSPDFSGEEQELTQSPIEREQEELPRTTEIFLPAYHFGNRPVVLQIRVSSSLSSSSAETDSDSSFTEILLHEIKRIKIPLPLVELDVRYVEDEQSLYIVHTYESPHLLAQREHEKNGNHEVTVHISVNTAVKKERSWGIHGYKLSLREWITIGAMVGIVGVGLGVFRVPRRRGASNEGWRGWGIFALLESLRRICGL